MNTIIINEKELVLSSASARKIGYGRYLVEVELMYEGEFMEFSAETTNMPDLDEATMLDDYEEQQMAYYELIEYKISEEIEEWIGEIEETCN